MFIQKANIYSKNMFDFLLTKENMFGIIHIEQAFTNKLSHIIHINKIHGNRREDYDQTDKHF